MAGSDFYIKTITIFVVGLLWLYEGGLGKRETDLLEKATAVFSIRILGLY